MVTTEGRQAQGVLGMRSQQLARNMKKLSDVNMNGHETDNAPSRCRFLAAHLQWMQQCFNGKRRDRHMASPSGRLSWLTGREQSLEILFTLLR